ncbi:asparagine synthetase B family protein [Sphingomonas koreensis]|nr:asparagine synthetase B family protein [Sphingomonas koreensis]
MRRARYLLVIGAPPQVARCCARIVPFVDQKGFTFADRQSGRFVIVDGPYIDLSGAGCAIGQMFKHSGGVALTSIGPSDQRAAVAGRGAPLLASYWGGYVAVVAAEHGAAIDIVRSPMGDLPCYYSAIAGAVLVSSDVALLASAGAIEASISWPALTRHISAVDIRRAETCLTGITELPGGQRLSIVAGAVSAVEPLWSPWTYAAASRQITDRQDAVRRVRGAVLHSVKMQASSYERIILRLSGGLDSSICAAALTECGQAFECLNLRGIDIAGDERSYARAVADKLGCRLTERTRRLDQVDLTISEAARLPRPSTRSFAQTTTAILTAMTGDDPTTAVFDGGGGDNVFCSLQSARPAIDCLLSERASDRFWPTVASVAMLSQISRWQIARRAWVMRRRWARRYPWPIDRRYLSADALAALAPAIDHSWFDATVEALPGKAAHVALIAQAQSVAEAADPQNSLSLFSPLLTQPVVETCLQTPSWFWFDRGFNRAVARDAFADLLPDSIVRRRSKGSPDGFVAALYEMHRDLIREMLMTGQLASQGLLDLAAIAGVLDDPRPAIGNAHLSAPVMRWCPLSVTLWFFSAGNSVSAGRSWV